MLRRHPARFLGFAFVAASAVITAQNPPVLDTTERSRARQMLQDIEQAVKDGYYDRTYRGIDLKAHFGAAREKIDTARSVGHAYAIIVQALVDVDDSHTFFIPPIFEREVKIADLTGRRTNKAIVAKKRGAP